MHIFFKFIYYAIMTVIEFNRATYDWCKPPCTSRLQLGSELDPGSHLSLVQWLQELTLRHEIKEWHLVTFPCLQSLTLGGHFNLSLEGATLPESLRCLSLGDEFNQSLETVAWSGRNLLGC